MVTLCSESSDRVWKAISDGKRRRILDALAERPRSTGELVDLLPEVGRTGVLKHISVLEAVDLVRFRREGRTRWNYVNPQPIKTMCNPWVERQIQKIASSIALLKVIAEENK